MSPSFLVESIVYYDATKTTNPHMFFHYQSVLPGGLCGDSHDHPIHVLGDDQGDHLARDPVLMGPSVQVQEGCYSTTGTVGGNYALDAQPCRPELYADHGRCS